MHTDHRRVCVCVCVCVCVWSRKCPSVCPVHACVRACVRARARARVCVCVREWSTVDIYVCIMSVILKDEYRYK